MLLKRCSIQAVNAITRQLFAPRESQRINWLVKFHQRFNFDLNFSVIGPIKLISFKVPNTCSNSLTNICNKKGEINLQSGASQKLRPYKNSADFLIILNSEIKCVSYNSKTVFKEYHKKNKIQKNQWPQIKFHWIPFNLHMIFIKVDVIFFS